MHGNGFELFGVALDLLVYDKKALEDWAAEQHLIGDFKLSCHNRKARKYILDDMSSILIVKHSKYVISYQFLISCYVNVYSCDLEDILLLQLQVF